MSRKKLMAHVLALDLCLQEGFTYDEARKLSEKLLSRFASCVGKALSGFDGAAEAEIKAQKQNLRRRYIEFFKSNNTFSDAEYTAFIIEILSVYWFEEKIDMILDRLEETLDGEVSGTAYDPVIDIDNEGKQLRWILKNAYLKGKNHIKSDETIYQEMELSRTTYFRRKKDAIVLFGILMWKYANAREDEDIAAGIVDVPEYKKENRKAIVRVIQNCRQRVKERI